MTNEVSIFNMAVPAYAKVDQSKAMQAMGSGLTGGGYGNRISLRGMRFRLIQNGTDVGAVAGDHLDVVIFAVADALQRTYYIKKYNPSDAPTPSDCFSHDGVTPSNESPAKQSDKCNTCKQNVKGSGNAPGTKACAYKKRVILCPEDMEGPSYALDVNGQSMFGEQIESANKFSFKGYFEKLTLHGLAIDAVITRLTFDDAASVPKLHFHPLRVLTKEEHAAILLRADDPEVTTMLKDLTNDREVEVAAPVVPATPAPQPKTVTLKVEAPAPKKGFTVAATAAPAAAVESRVKTLDIDVAALTKFDA